MEKDPRGALFARRYEKTCTIAVKFLAARNVPRFVHTEKQGGIIRARNRYSSVSFLHGQCYPLLFPRAISVLYIYCRGSTLISSVVIIVAFARTRPLARAIVSYASGSYVLQLTRSFSRLTRTTYVAQILFAKDCLCERDLRRRILLCRTCQSRHGVSRARERSRTILLFIYKKRIVLAAFYVFSDDCSKSCVKFARWKILRAIKFFKSPPRGKREILHISGKKISLSQINYLIRMGRENTRSTEMSNVKFLVKIRKSSFKLQFF